MESLIVGATVLPEGVAIRPATARDARELPKIERSAARAFRATDHAWVTNEGATSAGIYASLIASGDVYVAEAAGELVGFITTRPLADALHIHGLAVRHERQRQGIGGALMATARQHASDGRFPAMTLTTFADVPFNAPFYRKLGFEIVRPLPEHLLEILEAEARRGLTRRCAMRLAL